ncbi:hypothetical protein MCY_01569 [Bartonella rattimassiliensis 15908]|uniref:Uncharacterized protein n=1 Tax=Bartonella rattimassiliensis 15908 TaxID=1094556 RepID=J0Z611_9HYPH|nr:hypothetical protein MCY_01569 [Bartonella rattimassiliensis 15908]
MIVIRKAELQNAFLMGLRGEYFKAEMESYFEKKSWFVICFEIILKISFSSKSPKAIQNLKLCRIK